MYILKDEGFYAGNCETFVATSMTNNEFNIAGHVEQNTALINSSVAYLLADSDKNRTYRDHTVDIRTLYNKSLSGSGVPDIHFPYKETEPIKEEDEDVDDSLNAQQYISRHGQHFKKCAIQDSRLNLWFSIGVGFSYVMCGFLGPLMRKIGMRFYRLFFL